MKHLTLIALLSITVHCLQAQTDTIKKWDSSSPPTLSDSKPSTATKIDLADVDKNVNKNVELHGLVAGHKAFDKFFLIELGAAYPNQKLNILLTSTAFERFKTDGIDGNTIWVKGMIILYKGKPEIIVSRLDDIKILDH